MNIKIDQEKCIGCGSCTAVCPELFELGGEDNKARVRGAETEDKPAEKDDKCAQEAADICPVQAIEIGE